MVPDRRASHVNVEVCVAASDTHQTVSASDNITSVLTTDTTDTAEEAKFAQFNDSSSIFGALSRPGLNPIKPAYHPCWPDGRLS